jgi:hypothetical protein
VGGRLAVCNSCARCVAHSLAARRALYLCGCCGKRLFGAAMSVQCSHSARLRRSISLPLLAAVWLTMSAVVHARSPSHADPALPAPQHEAFAPAPLPRPLLGLERIRANKGGGAAPGVCRTATGTPCRPGGRSLSKERGRPLSPFVGERRLGPSPGAGGAAAASASRDWNTRGAHVSPSPGRAMHHTARKNELSGSSASAIAGSAARRVRPVRTATAMSANTKEYQVLGESVLWESPFGAMTIYERTVRFPDDDAGGSAGGGGGDDVPSLAKVDGLSESKTVRWHIVGCPLGNFSSVVIFPYDSRTGTCSLISEYCPGVDGVKSGIPGGLYEERKHSDLLNAAQDELNEEAGLIGGTWFALAPEGIPQDKYSRNRLHPYLVIDSSIDPNPRGQDDTEQITVEHGVSLAEAKRRLLAGDMPAPAAMVTLMAIDKLRELGYVR